MSRRSLNSRLYFVSIFFILIFAFLILRLVYVQLYQSAQLKAKSIEQHNIFTEIQPLRGTILDRNLKDLAVNTISYSVFAGKEFFNISGDREESEKALADILGLNPAELSARLNSEKNFVWLKRRVSPETTEKIKELNIPGIEQIREYQRFYPNGSLGSHIIGFTDVDNKGLEGMEFYCDSYLSGIKGWRISQRDAKRREVSCWDYKSILPSDGYNLVLTIDNVIQNIAERQLRAVAGKYNARSATAIVMNSKTGEILALCNYPDYDLNKGGSSDADARRNLAITDMFEPGSSFKFVACAAALEEKEAGPEDKIFCEKGSYRIHGRVLHDYRPYGELSFREVLEHSSNIGMAKIAERLGEETLYNYIEKFGFGSLTGIDLPGEVKGIARAPQDWSKTSIASIPMGQEIAVTPLQLICAISALANDGILVRPRILKSVQDKQGRTIKDFPYQQVRRVVSAEIAAELREMLAGCVENGTGKKAKVPGYKTAGKTGTAQKAKAKGGYYKNKYCASFVGFVPADDPVLSILVVLNEPYPKYFGGTVAAPIFRKIAAQTLTYLEMSGANQKYEAKRTD